MKQSQAKIGWIIISTVMLVAAVWSELYQLSLQAEVIVWSELYQLSLQAEVITELKAEQGRVDSIQTLMFKKLATIDSLIQSRK